MTLSQTQLSFTPTERGAYDAPDQFPDQLESLAAVDVEHHGLGREARAVGLVVADSRGEWYLPFAHAEGRQHDPARGRAWATEHLAEKDLIFRAAKNDLEVLRRWGLDLEALNARPHEVQHAAALLDDTRRKFDLETLMQHRLGRGKVALPFPAHTIWQQPADRVAPYARADARGTYDLQLSYQPD